MHLADGSVVPTAREVTRTEAPLGLCPWGPEPRWEAQLFVGLRVSGSAPSLCSPTPAHVQVASEAAWGTSLVPQPPGPFSGLQGRPSPACRPTGKAWAQAGVQAPPGPPRWAPVAFPPTTGHFWTQLSSFGLMSPGSTGGVGAADGTGPGALPHRAGHGSPWTARCGAAMAARRLLQFGVQVPGSPWLCCHRVPPSPGPQSEASCRPRRGEPALGQEGQARRGLALHSCPSGPCWAPRVLWAFPGSPMRATV